MGTAPTSPSDLNPRRPGKTMMPRKRSDEPLEARLALPSRRRRAAARSGRRHDAQRRAAPDQGRRLPRDHGAFVVREELGITHAIRHTCERLRKPAADISSLARGNPNMASRRIAPTTTLRASARGSCTTCSRAAFGGCRSSARPTLRGHPEDADASLTDRANHPGLPSPSPAGCTPASRASAAPHSDRSSPACWTKAAETP